MSWVTYTVTARFGALYRFARHSVLGTTIIVNGKDKPLLLKNLEDEQIDELYELLGEVIRRRDMEARA